MNGLLLSARAVLAVVFVVAAAGKFLDLDGSRKALTEFGVPSPMARYAAPALPLAELLVAVALLIRPSAVAGAVGALLLLLVFIGGVAYAMSQDRAPDCHCFGQLHSEPAGASTLIRNALLLAPAALIIAAGPGPSLAGALGGLRGAQIALVATAVVATVLAVATTQLLSDRRRLKGELARALAAKAPAGQPRGSQAPEFELTSVRGHVSSLRELLEPSRPVVLVFVSTTCEPCLAMLPTLADWQTSLSGTLGLAAIFAGEESDIERLTEEHGLSVSIAQNGIDLFSLYSLRATPSAVLIDPEGVIAGAPAEGVPAIEALVRSAVVRRQPAPLVIHRG
jgi:thiol-disulfide isomerase/thioredoxin/uncharacterized membrane protein YphA (DoxX/SURF4 family)